LRRADYLRSEWLYRKPAFSNFSRKKFCSVVREPLEAASMSAITVSKSVFMDTVDSPLKKPLAWLAIDIPVRRICGADLRFLAFYS
jgi:hypothetical protein